MSDAVDSAAPPPEVEPGYGAGELVAGRFRLQRLLGEGGMGWVWVAHDEQLDIDIALKLIRNDVSVPAAAERLLTEARALARIEHSGIVHVTDFGRTDRNDPFIAMELLEGEDLGQILERDERLPGVKALQLLLPVAEALAAAHARGIVHRDLKPDNVFLAKVEGRTVPKLIDFGIAKLDLQSKHTQAGVALGSPDYMAPEQARGQQDVDHRADVWAFCIMIYETITGHVPFEDASYNAVLRHVIESPIPSIFKHGLDMPELWAILERGFEKDRNERWQSMRELGVALANWLLDRGVSEDVTGSSLRTVWIDRPRPSLLSIPEVHFATGTVPRLETSSSIPPISEARRESLVPTRRRKLAFAGLMVFLLGAVGAVLVTHHRASAEGAAQAAQHPAVRGDHAASPAPSAIALPQPATPAVPAAVASASPSASAPAPPTPLPAFAGRSTSARPRATRPKAAHRPTAPRAPAPAASVWKPPEREDFGF